MTEPAVAREQILDEIAYLERELAERRATPRPPPASVLHAYQILLARHYDRLERFDARARATDERRQAKLLPEHAGRRSIIAP